jgi:hypothetical protein
MKYKPTNKKLDFVIKILIQLIKIIIMNMNLILKVSWIMTFLFNQPELQALLISWLIIEEKNKKKKPRNSTQIL